MGMEDAVTQSILGKFWFWNGCWTSGRIGIARLRRTITSADGTAWCRMVTEGHTRSSCMSSVCWPDFSACSLVGVAAGVALAVRRENEASCQSMRCRMERMR